MSNIRIMSDDEFGAMLDTLYTAAGKVASYHAGRAHGYQGGCAVFMERRDKWAAERGIVIPSANNRKIMTRAIRGQAQDAKQNKGGRGIKSAETEKVDGRPISRPYDQLTPSQRAISDGLAAMRRLGLMGGKI